MKIIDAHAHICLNVAGTTSKGELRIIKDNIASYATGDEFKMIPDSYGTNNFTYESLIKMMDDNGIEKAVLLQGNFLGLQNLYTNEAMLKYPSRFIGAASYDPFLSNKKQVLSHLFDELGFRIIKMEVSSSSGYMANRKPFSLFGKAMNEVYQMANDRNLVFVIDIGRPNSPSFQPENLLKTVKKYSKMNFVICHLFQPSANDSSLLESLLNQFKLPNVYFDIASLTNTTKDPYPHPIALKYLRMAKEIVGIDHLMWGSDAPSMVAKESMDKLISYIMSSNDFSIEEKENLFYNNANKVYFNCF